MVQFTAGKLLQSTQMDGSAAVLLQKHSGVPQKNRVLDALWISLSSDFPEMLKRELGVYAWTRRSVMKRKTTVFTHFMLSNAFQINPEISCNTKRVPILMHFSVLRCRTCTQINPPKTKPRSKL